MNRIAVELKKYFLKSGLCSVLPDSSAVFLTGNNSITGSHTGLLDLCCLPPNSCTDAEKEILIKICDELNNNEKDMRIWVFDTDSKIIAFESGLLDKRLGTHDIFWMWNYKEVYDPSSRLIVLRDRIKRMTLTDKAFVSRRDAWKVTMGRRSPKTEDCLNWCGNRFAELQAGKYPPALSKSTLVQRLEHDDYARFDLPISWRPKLIPSSEAVRVVERWMRKHQKLAGDNRHDYYQLLTSQIALLYDELKVLFNFPVDHEIYDTQNGEIAKSIITAITSIKEIPEWILPIE